MDVAHCSGMTRTAGSSNVFCNGIGVSRQGDNNTTFIIKLFVNISVNRFRGSGTVFVNGKGCGRVGDSITNYIIIMFQVMYLYG